MLRLYGGCELPCTLAFEWKIYPDGLYSAPLRSLRYVFFSAESQRTVKVSETYSTTSPFIVSWTALSSVLAFTVTVFVNWPTLAAL